MMLSVSAAMSRIISFARSNILCGVLGRLYGQISRSFAPCGRFVGSGGQIIGIGAVRGSAGRFCGSVGVFGLFPCLRSVACGIV